MTAADKFDHRPEAGFVRAYDARAAKRQFQVSVALVFVLAFAAIVLGILSQLDRPAAAARSLGLRTGWLDDAQIRDVSAGEAPSGIGPCG